jgi:hypothetical protein
MKTRFLLGTMCVSLSLAVTASASDLEDQAYDEGWDAADEFCRDVEERNFNKNYDPRDITERFEENCKDGFDAYINNNRTCARKIEDEHDGYRAMWRARRQSCT